MTEHARILLPSAVRIPEAVMSALGASQKKRAVSRAVGGAVLIILSAIAIYWLTHRGMPLRYVTAEIGKGRVTRVVSGSGTVNPVLTIIVGSYVSGVVQSISCDFNTNVKKGQLLSLIHI